MSLKNGVVLVLGAKGSTGHLTPEHSDRMTWRMQRSAIESLNGSVAAGALPATLRQRHSR